MTSVVPAVLRIPSFRRFWLASLASNAGSWLQVVAAGWLIFQITESPAAVGALALVARAPAFVLSGYAGQLADRFDRRAIGILTFAFQGAGSGILAVATAFDIRSVALIYATTFVVGVGFALGLPAMLAMVAVLAGRERMADAIALNAAGINVARLGGPALGGVVLTVAGPAWCFALNTVSFAVLVIVLARFPAYPPAPSDGRPRLRSALGYAWRNPAPRRLLIGMAIFATLAAPMQELAPVMADELGVGALGLGFLLGGMGGGALIGAWILSRLGRVGYPRHHALPTATILFAVSYMVLAGAPWFWLGLTAITVCGVFWIWMFIATNAAIQLGTDPSMVGRMLGLYQLAVLGPIALGSQLAGLVAEVVGIRWTLGGCAVLLGAWGVWSGTHRIPQIDGDAGPAEAGLREGILARHHRRAR